MAKSFDLPAFQFQITFLEPLMGGLIRSMCERDAARNSNASIVAQWIDAVLPSMNLSDNCRAR
jgi:hypothetical protein